jgi:hypothetical protein
MTNRHQVVVIQKDGQQCPLAAGQDQCADAAMRASGRPDLRAPKDLQIHLILDNYAATDG